MSTNDRVLGLDALRGLAALAVACTHFSTTYYRIYNLRVPTVSVDLGDTAVSLFFIISGFVILMTLDRSASVVDFAVSRFARLFPIFWACIVVTFYITRWMALAGRQVPVRDALLNATMAPSVFGARPVDVVYWTLTVELFFYIIVGAILALGLRRFLIPILSTLVLAGMVNQQWPLATVFPHGGFRIEHMMILGFWPMFLFGIVIYETRTGWKPRHSFAVVCCLAAVFFVGLGQGVGRCLLALVVLLVTRYRMGWLTTKPLLYLGAISYSFYLIHANVGYSLMQVALRSGCNPYAAELTALVATVAIASLLCFTVERSTNRAIRKAWKRYRTNFRLAEAA